MKRSKYRSEALMVIHQDMEGLYELGFVTDEEMRDFDEGCLVPEAVPVRGKAGVSAAPPDSAAGRESRPAGSRKKAAATKTGGRAPAPLHASRN